MFDQFLSLLTEILSAGILRINLSIIFLSKLPSNAVPVDPTFGFDLFSVSHHIKLNVFGFRTYNIKDITTD